MSASLHVSKHLEIESTLKYVCIYFICRIFCRCENCYTTDELQRAHILPEHGKELCMDATVSWLAYENMKSSFADMVE